MAYSKSPRPYRRYSVLMKDGPLYYMRAHDMNHAMKLAITRALRENLSPRVWDVFEGTVRHARS